MRTKQLTRDYLRDLISDIRCCRKWEQTAGKWEKYYASCLSELSNIFKNRHNTYIGKYGMPTVRGN